MKHISKIIPHTLAALSGDKTGLIKQKAAAYADIFISSGGSALAAAYKSDHDIGLYTDEEAAAAVRLTDVYIAVKEGVYTREIGAAKQKEILTELYGGRK